MLLPKRLKFRRHHRAKLKNTASPAKVVFGDYGLSSRQSAWVTSRQIEATRRVITRFVRRTGKIWIRIFPDKPITERAAESRMGSGKGTVAFWVAVVAPGTMLFEITGLGETAARAVLTLASHKLPVKTRILTKI
jgi:large subunit ribosomal protein L16